MTDPEIKRETQYHWQTSDSVKACVSNGYAWINVMSRSDASTVVHFASLAEFRQFVANCRLAIEEADKAERGRE